MTEDKAKTKWCPFARVVRIDSRTLFVRSLNSTQDVQSIAGLLDKINDRCVGSKCMAWRWTDVLSMPQKDRRGCCGLAGRP